MFNPEKLLQKVISEMAGSSNIVHSKKHKKKKKKKRKAKGLSDSLVSNLTSGKGLMAALALGVGAYTIAKSTKNTTVATTPTNRHLPPQPPSSSTATPPPIPGGSSPAPQKPQPKEVSQLAVRLIQVMIAAAWADGAIDAEEESKILQKLQGQALDREEKAFLLQELHNPKTIPQLIEDVNDPQVSQTMYSLAVATLVIDTEEERTWLDEFAKALGLSPEMQSFIEEEM